MSDSECSSQSSRVSISLLEEYNSENANDYGEGEEEHTSRSQPNPDSSSENSTAEDTSSRTAAVTNRAGGTNWSLPFEDNAEEFQLLSHQPNSELGLSNQSSPLEVLQAFIREEMIKTVCDESLRYARQKGSKNFDTFTEADFWRFFAIHLGMGIDQKPNIHMYWSKKDLFYTPFFANTMSRDRFIAILKNLNFVDNEAVPSTNRDRFIKLGNFLDSLLQNFRAAVHPGEYLCLDESLIPFKGKLSIKQYNPKKRTRFGVKIFVLVDCQTKMILDIVPYQGKNTKMKYRESIKDLGFGGTTVLSMLEPYFGLGHRVVVDNWFCSPKLARLLIEKQTYILGTVQKKRQDMPKGGKIAKKLPRGGIQTFSDGGILIERWNDRREVFILNTFMGHSMEESVSTNPANTREKPGTVLLYNSKMGAVDDADKIMQPYKDSRKSYKWYRKIVFHFMDLAVYNSYLLYQLLRGITLPYLDFLQLLITGILAKYPKPAVPRGRPFTQPRDDERLTGLHFPEKASRSNCVYCNKVYGLRVTSMFKCTTCNKRLCIDSGTSCFSLFHTQPVLRKVPTEFVKKQRQQERRRRPCTTRPQQSMLDSSQSQISHQESAVQESLLTSQDTSFEYSNMDL